MLILKVLACATCIWYVLLFLNVCALLSSFVFCFGWWNSVTFLHVCHGLTEVKDVSIWSYFVPFFCWWLSKCNDVVLNLSFFSKDKRVWDVQKQRDYRWMLLSLWSVLARVVHVLDECQGLCEVKCRFACCCCCAFVLNIKQNQTCCIEVECVFEQETICVVHKPCGLLQALFLACSVLRKNCLWHNCFLFNFECLWRFLSVSEGLCMAEYHVNCLCRNFVI